jgi:hypothetical protein
MNIKTEFEKFLAVKAEEFVSKKTNMTIAEFRELNAVLDTCGIDFSTLSSLVELPATKRIKYAKSNISTQNLTDYIFSTLTSGNMVTMKELYQSSEIHFHDIISDADTTIGSTGMPRIKTRIYTQVHALIKQGRLASFRSNDGKVYFHRVRNQKLSSESQLTVTL